MVQFKHIQILFEFKMIFMLSEDKNLTNILQVNIRRIARIQIPFKGNFFGIRIILQNSKIFDIILFILNHNFTKIQKFCTYSWIFMDLNTFPCDRHKLYHFRKVQSHPHYFSENNEIFWRENSNIF